MTVIGALIVNGLESVMELDGVPDALGFALYLEQVPGPTLQPGGVVVRASLPVHKVAGMRERLEAHGTQVPYLPPYSPDLAPIARGGNKLKTGLRTAQARTREVLAQTLATATDWITSQDAQNWFAGCGYRVHWL